MAKEWILNSATNRFQMNFKRDVGAVSEEIRKCAPKTIFDLVIKRTFDGYMTERATIYGQLQEILGVKIEPAPDEWDRLFNVDFFIKLNGKYIGLQIKPAGGVSHISQIFKERQLQEKTHKKFAEKYGGKVFYVISIKEGDKKKIHNTEVINEIKQEIERLGKI